MVRRSYPTSLSCGGFEYPFHQGGWIFCFACNPVTLRLAVVRTLNFASTIDRQRRPFAFFVIERRAVVFVELAGTRVVAVGGQVDGEYALVVESYQRFG